MTLVFGPGIVLAIWAVAVALKMTDPAESFVPFIIAEVIAWIGYVLEIRRGYW